VLLQHKFREVDANGNWKLNAGSAIEQMGLDTTKSANASDVSDWCICSLSRLRWCRRFGTYAWLLTAQVP
jgi:hypothetical protein